MTKPTVTDARFDFRGGRNTAISPDLLNPNELVDATNTRLTATYGGFTKRTGCQRIHQTAFPGIVRGVHQWDDPVSGLPQVVVIADGDLHYRNGFTYSTAFTTVDVFAETGFNFATTAPTHFVTFRAATANAPLVLFLASNGILWKWDGDTLTDLTGANDPNADMLIAYHTRLFARDSERKKHAFWSKIGDGESWVTGTKADGGSAMVNVLGGDVINNFETIGSSLIITTTDCVMRFTGHATDDIVIAQDTEGISAEVGAVGDLCLKRFENVAAMLTERGPYAVTETEVVPIGEQIGPDFANVSTPLLPFSVVGWNKGRKELWFAIPGPSDSSQNRRVYVQGVRLQCWYGPWVYPFGITYITRYEDDDGRETILTGGADGFVRDMDVGTKDDVLYNGTGGSNIAMVVELPVIQFGLPGITKALTGIQLQANVPTGSNLEIQIAFDDQAFTAYPVLPTTGEDNQRIDLAGQGKRLYMQFTDDSDQMPGVNGFVLEGYNYGRR